MLLRSLLRCRFCGKARDPREFISNPKVAPCWTCFEWHRKALRMLAGECFASLVCVECGIATGELKLRTPGGDFRMYVHPKDGIYQILCQACSDKYEARRADFYRGTAYGHAKKL